MGSPSIANTEGKCCNEVSVIGFSRLAPKNTTWEAKRATCSQAEELCWQAPQHGGYQQVSITHWPVCTAKPGATAQLWAPAGDREVIFAWHPFDWRDCNGVQHMSYWAETAISSCEKVIGTFFRDSAQQVDFDRIQKPPQLFRILATFSTLLGSTSVHGCQSQLLFTGVEFGGAGRCEHPRRLPVLWGQSVHPRQLARGLMWKVMQVVCKSLDQKKVCLGIRDKSDVLARWMLDFHFKIPLLLLFINFPPESYHEAVLLCQLCNDLNTSRSCIIHSTSNHLQRKWIFQEIQALSVAFSQQILGIWKCTRANAIAEDKCLVISGVVGAWHGFNFKGTRHLKHCFTSHGANSAVWRCAGWCAQSLHRDCIRFVLQIAPEQYEIEKTNLSVIFIGATATSRIRQKELFFLSWRLSFYSVHTSYMYHILPVYIVVGSPPRHRFSNIFQGKTVEALQRKLPEVGISGISWEASATAQVAFH